MGSRCNNKEVPAEASIRGEQGLNDQRETWGYRGKGLGGMQHLKRCGGEGEEAVTEHWALRPGFQKEGWYH